MRYQAVIFDLFGTLADLSFRGMDGVVSEMASSLSMTNEAYAPRWAETYPLHERGAFPSTEASIEHACRGAGVHPMVHQVIAAATLWQAFQRRILAPRPEAVVTLARLKGTQRRIGLIANCPLEVPLLWPRTSFAALVDVPLFSSEIGLRKPDPLIYLLACDRLGVPPRRCLFVGDGGSHELTGATRAGMDAVQLRVAEEDPYDVQRFGREAWQGSVILHLTEVLTLMV